MRPNSYRENRDEIDELLRQYNDLRNGLQHSFLEEDSFEKIINYFDDKDDLKGALEAAETGVEYFPFSSQLLIKKADLLIATQKYNEALQILEQAQLFDAGDLYLYILKTDVYLALDQQDKAVVILEEALQIFEGEERIELLFELADVYDDYEEFDKVFDCLKLILEEEPTSEEALYKICFWTDFTGRAEESIHLHQSIIDNYPYNELAWFNLAAAYQGLKLYEKAIDAYQFAVVIDEKFETAYRNMGDAYISIRKYKEAIEALEKVLELSRPDQVIFEAIAHCYHMMKNYALARFHYRKASHMNPGESKLHYKIAMTYMNEKQWQSALKPLESAMNIKQNVAEYNLAMGDCKMELGNFKQAIHFFGISVKQKPKNISGWEALIGCLYKAGYFEEACAQSLSAITATEGKPVFYYLYSAALFAMNKQKEGLAQLEKGLNRSIRQLKKLVDINPAILQNNQVVDMIARFKKKNKFR